MPPCIACNQPVNKVVGNYGRYRIRHCNHCGLQFSDPMIAATSHYSDAYDGCRAPTEIAGEGLPYLQWTESASADLMEFESFLTSAQQFALRLARRRFPQAESVPALEIGFGAGWFMGALRASGFTPYGLEVADAPVSVLSAKGFAACKSSDGKLPSDWPNPRLITAFEVVEHLEDPVTFLSRLCRSHPDAELILSVPDERRWFLLGGREDHDYPPNHLTRWTPQALECALRRAGFLQVEVWRLPPTAQELSRPVFDGLCPWDQATSHPGTPVKALQPLRSLRRCEGEASKENCSVQLLQLCHYSEGRRAR